MSRRFAAADPSGQEYMELDGNKQRYDLSGVRVTHIDATDPYPDAPKQGVISLFAGNRKLGYLIWSLDEDTNQCDIGRVWLTAQARGWGLGEKLYQELVNLIKAQYPRTKSIGGDIHTQEALKARLRALGKPRLMEAVHGERFPVNENGVQEASELLWPAEKSFPKEGMDPQGPYVSVMHDLHKRRDFNAREKQKIKDIGRSERTAAADPTGQEYMEFEGIGKPRLKQKQIQTKHSDLTEDKRHPQGEINLFVGGMPLGGISYTVGWKNRIVSIENIWIDPRGRNWGLGERLYNELIKLIHAKYPYVTSVQGEIYSKEALKSRLKTLGVPEAMNTMTNELKTDIHGVSEAYETLLPAEESYPDKNGIVYGPNVWVSQPARKRKKWADPEALEKIWKKQSSVCKRAERMGLYQEADSLDKALIRVSQAQTFAPATTEQMSQFMEAISQLSELIAKHEQRLNQIQQGIRQMQQGATPDNSVKQNNPAATNGIMDITAPPGTNINLTANSPSETNTEINL